MRAQSPAGSGVFDRKSVSRGQKTVTSSDCGSSTDLHGSSTEGHPLTFILRVIHSPSQFQIQHVCKRRIMILSR